MNESTELADIPCDIMSPKYPRWQGITIGNSIVCDGYHEGKTTAVFSHFHRDHTHNFARTLTRCHNVILSKITYDALRMVDNIPERGTIKVLSEGESFRTELGEKIELFDANHVPGSRQVLVTMEDHGERILYSGDFSYPDIIVPKADILILESEHGEGVYDFSTDKSSVLRRICEHTISQIEKGHPVEIKAHPGTIQNIMAELENETSDGMMIPEKVPFLADEASVNLTEAIKGEYNHEIRKIEMSSNGRLNELYGDGTPYVLFSRHSVNTSPQSERGTVIHVDANKGFKTRGPWFTNDDHMYFACLASHSSFTNVLEYVKTAGPRLVIVDGTRANPETAKSLKHHIQDDLEIQAIVKDCET